MRHLLRGKSVSNFTRKDVCELLGVETHRVRQWMQLAPFSARQPRARSPHRYDLHDLQLLAIAHDLQDRFGLPPAVLDRILPEFQRYLNRSHATTHSGRVLFNIETGVIEEPTADLPAPGLVVDLAAAHERVERFLGLIPTQSSLPLFQGSPAGERS